MLKWCFNAFDIQTTTSILVHFQLRAIFWGWSQRVIIFISRLFSEPTDIYIMEESLSHDFIVETFIFFSIITLYVVFFCFEMTYRSVCWPWLVFWALSLGTFMVWLYFLQSLRPVPQNICLSVVSYLCSLFIFNFIYAIR